MASSFQPDVSSIRYLTGKFLEEVGRKVASSDVLASLDDDVLHFDALTSYFTEKDESFRKEWETIQADRARNEDLLAEDEEHPEAAPDISFRYRELRCMVRSAIRQGVLYKVEPPKTTWDPKELTAT